MKSMQSAYRALLSLLRKEAAQPVDRVELSGVTSIRERAELSAYLNLTREIYAKNP